MIKDFLHTASEESGKEKHVPYIQVDKNMVKISCGKDVMHPSTEQHYIQWMKLFGVDAEGKIRELGSGEPTPVLAQPVVAFSIDVTKFKKLMAIIYCNIHGLWESELAL